MFTYFYTYFSDGLRMLRMIIIIIFFPPPILCLCSAVSVPALRGLWKNGESGVWSSGAAVGWQLASVSGCSGDSAEGGLVEGAIARLPDLFHSPPGTSPPFEPRERHVSSIKGGNGKGEPATEYHNIN